MRSASPPTGMRHSCSLSGSLLVPPCAAAGPAVSAPLTARRPAGVASGSACLESAYNGCPTGCTIRAVGSRRAVSPLEGHRRSPSPPGSAQRSPSPLGNAWLVGSPAAASLVPPLAAMVPDAHSGDLQESGRATGAASARSRCSSAGGLHQRPAAAGAVPALSRWVASGSVVPMPAALSARHRSASSTALATPTRRVMAPVAAAAAAAGPAGPQPVAASAPVPPMQLAGVSGGQVLCSPRRSPSPAHIRTGYHGASGPGGATAVGTAVAPIGVGAPAAGVPPLSNRSLASSAVHAAASGGGPTAAAVGGAAPQMGKRSLSCGQIAVAGHSRSALRAARHAAEQR